MSLRLPKERVQAIAKLRHVGNGKISVNAWIDDAIREKLERDSVREAPTPAYNVADRSFYEFFAGGGMARLGLGKEWCCLFANDFDPLKARAYQQNWNGGHELMVGDVNSLTLNQLPGQPDLVWASFPCQDLSLAGKNAGIGKENDRKHTRSGTFWPFWRLLNGLREDGRGPKVVVLENVYGILTSRDGKDFEAVGSAFVKSGYKFGAVVIDAKYFVPQSRPRVFIIGIQSELFIPKELTAESETQPWHVRAVLQAHAQMDRRLQENWIWWTLPIPSTSKTSFADLIEENPSGVEWHSKAETKRLLGMMSPLNLMKVELARKSGRRHVGGVYRRTRVEGDGKKKQRAEVRFDNVAGCLRTPSGGSSRQLILVVEKNSVRSRLLSPREAARLMGLPDSYRLPTNYNDAYHLCGDGVAAPVVRHLAAHLLEPLIENNRNQALLPLRVA